MEEENMRQDLADLYKRKAYLADESRPEAVEKRRKKGQRTARENIADLCDPDSFLEHGSLIVAGQRGRKVHTGIDRENSCRWIDSRHGFCQWRRCLGKKLPNVWF